MEGDDATFRLLGILFDCELTMEPCLVALLNKLRPKVRALVRTKHVYSIPDMLNQFKAHVWSHIEYCSGALLLAGPIKLRKLDKLQRGFLYELGLNDRDAFVEHNFTPPSIRRAIGMLGFLHKIAPGRCHPLLPVLFPADPDTRYRYHARKFASLFDSVTSQRALFARSIHMYILMYNRLPQSLVDSTSVKILQGRLTHIARHRAQQDVTTSWREAFQSCEGIVDFFSDNPQDVPPR